MMNLPIDEISCCNCGSCQAYFLALVKRIEQLEQQAAPVMRSMYEAQAMYEDEEDLMKIQAKESEDEAAYYGRGFDAEYLNNLSGHNQEVAWERAQEASQPSDAQIEAEAELAIERKWEAAERGYRAMVLREGDPLDGYPDETDTMDTFYSGVEK